MSQEGQNKEKFKFQLRDRTLVMIDWANVYNWHKRLGCKIVIQKLFSYLNTYPKIIQQRFYHGVYNDEQWTKDIKDEAERVGFNVVSKEGKWVPFYLNKQSHLKIIVQQLFNVLDSTKNTNSAIATKLYELREKIEGRLADREPDFDSDGDVQGEFPPYTPEDQKLYDSAYELIEGLDKDLKKLNINIEELQQNLLGPIKRRKCDFDVEIARDVCNLVNDFDTLLLFSGDGDYAALVEDLIVKGKKAIVVFAPGHKGKEYELLQENLKKTGKNSAFFVCTVNNIKEGICA